MHEVQPHLQIAIAKATITTFISKSITKQVTVWLTKKKKRKSAPERVLSTGKACLK